MPRYAIWMVTVGAAALAGLSCGGSPTVIPSPAPPTTTLPTQPSPSPSPSPSPIPGAQNCTFAPGPVERLAIQPRGDSFQTDRVLSDLFVRALPNWDEVVCLDKDKSYRLDFNANQRNADGRECCYEGVVSWTVLEDSDQIITSHGRRGDNEDGFIWRFFIDPQGRQGVIQLEAELDGVKSYPWQSASGYRREPIRIVSMSATEIARDCQCIYRGNGVYEGARCPK